MGNSKVSWDGDSVSLMSLPYPWQGIKGFYTEAKGLKTLVEIQMKEETDT